MKVHSCTKGKCFCTLALHGRAGDCWISAGCEDFVQCKCANLRSALARKDGLLLIFCGLGGAARKAQAQKSERVSDEGLSFVSL